MSLLLSGSCRGSLVDLAASTLSESDDSDCDRPVFDAINQTVSCRSQHDLVMMFESVQGITGDAWRLQSFSQFLLELFPDDAAEFLPFLQGRRQKLKVIAH